MGPSKAKAAGRGPRRAIVACWAGAHGGSMFKADNTARPHFSPPTPGSATSKACCGGSCRDRAPRLSNFGARLPCRSSLKRFHNGVSQEAVLHAGVPSKNACTQPALARSRYLRKRHEIHPGICLLASCTRKNSLPSLLRYKLITGSKMPPERVFVRFDTIERAYPRQSALRGVGFCFRDSDLLRGPNPSSSVGAPIIAEAGGISTCFGRLRRIARESRCLERSQRSSYRI